MEKTDRGIQQYSAVDADLEEMIGYNLRRATAVMLEDFDVEFAAASLRPTTFGMLATIDERPGLSSAQLGRILGIKRANIVPLLAELEKRGLVERQEHAEDGRVSILHLTASARENMASWRRQALRHESRVLCDLSPKEQATLLRLLRRVWKREG